MKSKMYVKKQTPVEKKKKKDFSGHFLCFNDGKTNLIGTTFMIFEWFTTNIDFVSLVQ